MSIRKKLELMKEIKSVNDARVREYLEAQKKAVSENGTMAPVHG